METFVKNLISQLITELKNIDTDISPVQGYDQRIRAVRKAIKNLNQYVRENPFPDKAAEIRYFKRIAPYFYGHLFYFKLRYNLEIYKITELKGDFPSYLENKLAIVKRFLFKYGVLHRYYYSLQQHWDEELRRCLAGKAWEKVTGWKGYGSDAGKK